MKSNNHPFFSNFLGLIVLITLILGFTDTGYGQVTGDYQSNVPTGAWGTVGTWQRYNGSAWVAATVVPTATNNVTIQIGNTITISATAVCANLSILGTLTLGNSITVSGTTSVSGTITHSSTTGTRTFTGLVTINTNGIWNNSVNEGITFGG